MSNYQSIMERLVRASGEFPILTEDNPQDLFNEACEAIQELLYDLELLKCLLQLAPDKMYTNGDPRAVTYLKNVENALRGFEDDCE